MEKITINPIIITYTTESGREHSEEITKVFQNIFINKGGKIMDGQGAAMREQPFVARINDLLDEVDKEICSFEHDVDEINKRLLPFPIPPGIDEVKKKAEAEALGVETKIPQQEGWFVQTIITLERLRNDLRGISRGKIRELKKAIGLLEPEKTKDLGGEEIGC